MKYQEKSAAQSTSGLIGALTKSKPKLFSPTTTKVKFQTVHFSEDDDDYGSVETDLVLQDQDFNGAFNKHVKLPGATFMHPMSSYGYFKDLDIRTRVSGLIVPMDMVQELDKRMLRNYPLAILQMIMMTTLSYVRQIQATSENTSRLTYLAEASRKDQDRMLNIAMSAQKDSELMKVIAIASLITLPTILTTVVTPPTLQNKYTDTVC
ncbi:hypothetical protein F52700_10577 [Fusarium sp. NRRL 52700]|nr:hypothetical protein F52700_10577 [Fusarium sp. NRRL 52700]